MKYMYTEAWIVLGGIWLREESQSIELGISESAKFILTSAPDAYLAEVDKRFAIGRLVLMGLVGRQRAADFQTELDTEINEIKAERKKKIGQQSVLLFQAQGEIEVKGEKPTRKYDTFSVTFDAVEMNSIRQRYKADIDSMKTAIAFESDEPSSFAFLTDGACLLDDENKPVYSFSFSVSGEASVYKYLSEDAAKRIAVRYDALKKEQDIDSVTRLFSQMAEQGTDRLKAFLSGWAALEILIAKSFKSYEQVFLTPFTKAEQPTLRERFLERITEVMKDKYRLTDKFIAVTAILFPGIEDSEAKKNLENFRKLKKMRDDIFHGEPFIEKDLPVHDLSVLLRKYFVARMDIIVK